MYNLTLKLWPPAGHKRNWFGYWKFIHLLSLPLIPFRVMEAGADGAHTVTHSSSETSYLAIRFLGCAGDKQCRHRKNMNISKSRRLKPAT